MAEGGVELVRLDQSVHFSGENASGAQSVETIFVRLAGPPTGRQTPCLTASARIWARASTLS